MKRHTITGGGGTQLHAVETGHPRGRPIVFIHGFSQSWRAWSRQLGSELADRHRLVALDVRGHGLSDKPREGYDDSRLWAEDVHAVIRNLELDHPVLCGWSYGPLVILDYIRHYGQDEIAGANFVGGVTKLGGEDALSVLDGGFLSLIPGFFSADAEESVRSLASLLNLCFTRDLSIDDYYLMLGCSVSVPPYVRRALFSRLLDNDDLLPRLVKPVLIAHGARDAVVKPAVIEQQMARIPHTEVRLLAEAGHACFWDDAQTYNRYLRDFVDGL
jgi:non-heme chloroperoxidase